jgi:hypothetical protein
MYYRYLVLDSIWLIPLAACAVIAVFLALYGVKTSLHKQLGVCAARVASIRDRGPAE